MVKPVHGVGFANDPLHESGEAEPQRRMLLTGLTAAYLSSFLTAAEAQPAADVTLDEFSAVSRILTGRPSLERDQSARLFEALAADDPQFGSDVGKLLAWIMDRKIDPSQFQRALDSEGSELAAVPRKIVTAWYTGIVGEGAHARCITFETSLMHVVVADRLHLPSYCYGQPGSWIKKPA